MFSVDKMIEQHHQEGTFAQIDGLRIFYRKAGSGKGIPLVLTHGVPRSSFLYRKMIPILAEDHPVRALDLYGFGLSDKPRDRHKYSFSKFEEFLAKFIDQLGIEKFHLICHDVGGPFSIGYAVRNPERVKTLTILNTTIFLKDHQIPRLVLFSIFLPLALHRLVMSDDRFCNAILKTMRGQALKNPKALNSQESVVWKYLLSRNNGRLSFTRTVKAYRSALPYLMNIQKALPGFKRPTLVLWGRHDPFCTLPTARRFEQLIENCEVKIIDDASHFIQEDAPEEASKIILEFVNRK